MRLHSPRMLWCALVTVALMILLWFMSPQQLPVIAYKLTLILLAAFVAYWVDRWLFPYARPDSSLPQGAIVYAAAQVRRAIIVAAAMLAVGMGL